MKGENVPVESINEKQRIIMADRADKILKMLDDMAYAEERKAEQHDNQQTP